jgi:CelD/BcsL family acetyltransferase involved in cellulose biosynthesis
MPLAQAQEAWMRLFKTTRNYVRRAEKNGVRIEVAQEESVIHEFYEQLKAIFAKQNLKPSHSIEWLLNMWRCAHPTGDLIGLRALHGNRCIATYILACDDRVMWGLATASRPDALELRPNELIHWRAIEMACERGLQRYDFCGGGSYKKKYGSEELPRIRWQKAYSRSALLAYRCYISLWSGARQIVRRGRGWMANIKRHESVEGIPE